MMTIADLAGGARILDGLSLAEYFSDPFDVPSLSQSIAKILVDESPLHAWYAHPKLGKGHREATDEMAEGSLLHALALGVGPEVVPVDALDWRTKAAKEARAEIEARGEIPVLAHKLEAAKKRAVAVGRDLESMGVTFGGASEVMIGWVEKSPTGPVLCRGMLDHLAYDGKLGATIYDLKFVQSAHPRDCARRAAEMGWDIQAEAYTRAVERLKPGLLGRVAFKFLFCETKPPHCITIASMGGLYREVGRIRWEQAVNLWGRCLSTGKWPGYATSEASLTAPPWVVAGLESEAAEENEGGQA